MKVEEEVLARLKPSQEDEAAIQETVAELIETVKNSEAASKVDFEPYLVGSIAKGTHLKDPDADLFLLFNPELPREELEKHGLAIGRESIDGREHYAEHPYIKGRFKGLRADIVPAYKIIDSSQKMTAVDRTPFHTEYVKKHLAPELRDDVRLLKAFMKGIGTYGADAKTMGFSGYLCEILVIRFGGFRRLLAEASEWRSGVCLELSGQEPRRFDSPMTFIDPVDETRNVASAVSTDCLATFIAAAKAYLAEQSLKFYFPREVETLSAERIGEKLAHRGDMVVITMPVPDLIDDILYPQLRKFEKNACQMLSSSDFKVMDSSSYVEGDRMAIVIELENATLPVAALHPGPPVWVAENSDNFLIKWRGNANALSSPFVRDGHWHVFVRRKHTSAVEALGAGLASLDTGKDLNRQKDSMRVLDELPDDPFVNSIMSKYLDRRMPWER